MIRELWIKYFKDPSAHFDLAISGWLKSTKEVAVHGYRSQILFKNEAVSDISYKNNPTSFRPFLVVFVHCQYIDATKQYIKKN